MFQPLNQCHATGMIVHSPTNSQWHTLYKKTEKKIATDSPLEAKSSYVIILFKSIFGELFRIRFEVGGGVKDKYKPLKSPLRILKIF